MIFYSWYTDDYSYPYSYLNEKMVCDYQIYPPNILSTEFMDIASTSFSFRRGGCFISFAVAGDKQRSQVMVAETFKPSG